MNTTKPPAHRVVLEYMRQLLKALKELTERGDDVETTRSNLTTLCHILYKSGFPTEVQEEIIVALRRFEVTYGALISFLNLPMVRHRVMR